LLILTKQVDTHVVAAAVRLAFRGVYPPTAVAYSRATRLESSRSSQKIRAFCQKTRAFPQKDSSLQAEDSSLFQEDSSLFAEGPSFLAEDSSLLAEDSSIEEALRPGAADLFHFA